MAAVLENLRLTGLGKQKFAALIERAKQLGMSPQRYLKHLVEEDLTISERAKSTTFEELLPATEVDELELDRMVNETKRRHRSRGSK